MDSDLNNPSFVANSWQSDSTQSWMPESPPPLKGLQVDTLPVPNDEVPDQPCSPPAAERDRTYYLDFVVFSVEDRLYMVPKYHFEKATGYFLFRFDEETPEKPVKLEDVKKIDFEAILKLMYPLNPTYEEPILSSDEWVSVLKLSSQWAMLNVREMAIKALAGCPSVIKVIPARQYSIFEWLRTAYIHFAEREESLSVDDAEVLGLEVAMKLIHIREDFLQRNHREWKRRNGSSARGVLERTHDTPVDTEFSRELKEAQSLHSVDAVDRVILARTYNVAEWLRSAYIDLAEREEGISLDEARKLGMETAINLCRAKESSLKSYSRYLGRDDYGSVIDKEFEEELRTVRVENDRYRPGSWSSWGAALGEPRRFKGKKGKSKK